MSGSAAFDRSIGVVENHLVCRSDVEFVRKRKQVGQNLLTERSGVLYVRLRHFVMSTVISDYPDFVRPLCKFLGDFLLFSKAVNGGFEVAHILASGVLDGKLNRSAIGCGCRPLHSELISVGLGLNKCLFDLVGKVLRSVGAGLRRPKIDKILRRYFSVHCAKFPCRLRAAQHRTDVHSRVVEFCRNWPEAVGAKAQPKPDIVHMWMPGFIDHVNRYTVSATAFVPAIGEENIHA